MYETTDSGARQEWETGMQRDTTEGKPRFDLLIPEGLPFDEQMLTRIAMLMTRGAEKYNPRNWEKARTEDELARFRDSAFRHFMEWFMNVDDNEDHAAAIFFNVMGAERVKYILRSASA